MLIRCDVPGNATLLLKPKEKNDTVIDLSVDNKKIELVSKNVFNITRLAYNDTGDYMCQSGMSRGPNRTFTTLTRYRLVLKEGKIYLNH